MPLVLITGGTGLIGKVLTNLLIEKGYEVIIVSRGNVKEKLEQPPGVSYVEWDVKKQTIDISAIQRADYIVHLAGAGVAEKRWTEKRQKEIVESRTLSSALLVKALQQNSNKVKAIVSASAIGWYGADATIPNLKPYVETDPADSDFLGETCQQWEASIQPVTILGKRLVFLRTGIVLSKQGGALEEFVKPLRVGIAAILGSGKQVISWIHVDDLCRMYIKAIEDETMNAVYNAVAPSPVSNKELVLELAKKIRKEFYIPVHVPAFVLKIMLGEMSIEVLKSTTVSANKVRQHGFNFIYPTLVAAVNQLTTK